MGELDFGDLTSLVPESEAPVLLTQGQKIGRYIVETEIHSGDGVTIYRGRHNMLDSAHALKVVNVSSPSVKDALVAEGRRLAKLQHPNLVLVSDVVPVGDAAAVVMEFVDGPTLEVWLTTNNPSREQALELFAGVARGVREAQHAGLIHANLCPAHILIEDAGGVLRPKITGFGVARSADGTQLDPAHPSMGDPRYAAPEQFEDARVVDQRVDLYALGCILYELLAGKPLYAGSDAFSVMAEMEQPWVMPDGMPTTLRVLLKQLLKTDPAQRMKSAVEAVDAVRPLIAEHSSEHPMWTANNPTLPGVQPKAEEPASRSVVSLSPPVVTPTRSITPAMMLAAGLPFVTLGLFALWTLVSG